ncbi:MAG TPA: LON peptidase substrate-binding domain-containing protein [Cyclobacteriaceae bacterium]|nr:LON peptidase substrate-binding domain-containing protein [Cyclobacteriaceae bacterium]
MADRVRIPMFPLSIFPLPGELVPLHIFEPRYRQLLIDAEDRDITFGIYFNHVMNVEKVGSLVKLESVIKRHEGGESDIIVKCQDLFRMETLFRNYKDKMYPGGEVECWHVDLQKAVSEKLHADFVDFMQILKINKIPEPCSIFHVANELSLDLDDKIKFVSTDDDKKESFLSARIKFQKHLHSEAEKSKDVFHLN